MFAACVLSYVDRQAVAILIQPIKTAFNLSDTQIGLLQGFAFALCWSLAMLPLSRSIDRSSRTGIASVCVLIWSLATSACGLVTCYPLFVLARAGTAISEAGVNPAALSIFADLFDSRRLQRANSVFYVGPYLGGGLALLVGGAALNYFTGIVVSWPPALAAIAPWRWVMIVLGIPGAFLFVLMRLTVREPKRQEVEQIDTMLDNVPTLAMAWKHIFVEHPFLRWHFSAYVFVVGVYYSLVTWFPTVMIRDFGLSARAVGGYLGPVYIVAGITGAMSVPLLLRSATGEDLLSRVFNLQASLAALLIPLTATASLAGNLTMMLVLYGASTFIGSMLVATIATPLQLTMPNRIRGQSMALMAFVTAVIGGGLGPVIVGLLADHVYVGQAGLGTALSITCASAATFGFVLLILTQRNWLLTQTRNRLIKRPTYFVPPR